MGMEYLGDLIAEIRKAQADLDGIIDNRDQRYIKRFDALEGSINEFYKKLNRPGAESTGADTDARKDAVDYCILKHAIAHPKADTAEVGYAPSPDEIDTATIARRAIEALWHHGNVERLDNLHKKSLTSFAFGSNQFVLPPQLSNRVLSCLTDYGDVASLMGQESTGGGSLKFLIDNVRMGAGWACEASCFANNPQPDLQEGLGELEIKPETIRFVCCVGRGKSIRRPF